MLSKKGVPNAFDEYLSFEDRLWSKLLKTTPQSFGLKKPTPKEIKSGLNRLRNELKHNDSGRNKKIEAVYEYEAEEMILRAVKTTISFMAFFPMIALFGNGLNM